MDMQLAETFLKQSKSEVMTRIDIETILNGITSSDNATVFACIKSMRRLLSASTVPDPILIESIVKQGVLPICVAYLTSFQHPELQYETTWLLLNVATGSDEQTRAIIDAGGIPRLIHLLDTSNQKIIEVAVWTLSNLACEGNKPRDLMISNNIVVKIVRILTDTNTSLQTLQVTTWLCTNLCYPIYYNAPSYEHVQALLRPLINLLDRDNEKVVKNSAQAIRYILRRTQVISDALNLNLLDKLTEMFRNSHKTIVSQAALTLSAISRGNMSDNDRILENYDLMMAVKDALTSNDVTCLKEVTWALFKILSRTSNLTIRNFVNMINIFDILVDLLTWNNESLNNVVNLLLNLLRDQSGVTYLEIEE